MKEAQVHQKLGQELLEEVEATQTQTLMEVAQVALVRLQHQVVLIPVQAQVQVQMTTARLETAPKWRAREV